MWNYTSNNSNLLIMYEVCWICNYFIRFKHYNKNSFVDSFKLSLDVAEITEKAQESKSSDFNTGYWIKILVVILIGANIVAFTAYYLSQPDPHLPTLVWNYLKSEQFKIITVTIILPIIILLLEYFA